MPIQPSAVLSTPSSVLKVSRQTTAIATVEATSGMNMILRKMPMPLSFRFRAAATARLMAIVGISVPTVKITVLRNATQNSGSWAKSRRKLSMPMNFGELNRSHRCRLRYKVNTNGNAMNTATAIRLGAMNIRPAAALRRRSAERRGLPTSTRTRSAQRAAARLSLTVPGVLRDTRTRSAQRAAARLSLTVPPEGR